MRNFSDFLKDDSGAVTVDWVVLTAAIVGLGLIVFLAIRPAVSDLASSIAHTLQHVKGCLDSGGTGHSCPS
ncbi:Flp family type IVb pilin [Tabrizicola sp.]|uniref:Flp family type IVb pilin n=1 Tax=Tabrizicola sp. TaxID=2005166 RepID=UPI003F36AF06